MIIKRIGEVNVLMALTFSWVKIFKILCFFAFELSNYLNSDIILNLL